MSRCKACGHPIHEHVYSLGRWVCLDRGYQSHGGKPCECTLAPDCEDCGHSADDHSATWGCASCERCQGWRGNATFGNSTD